MANSLKTPLLRPLRTSGSTLYVFQSAQEDIGLNINNSALGAALSSFALLNLNSNNFKPVTPDTDVALTGITDANQRMSRRIALDIQNYLMNFETVLLNETDYDFTQPGTVSEKAFWHWMQKCGLKLEATGTEGVYRESVHDDNPDSTIPRCQDPNRIIQCFGQIDAGNSLSTEFGMYNETYVSIPTSYGNGPVFFRVSDSYEDSNYRASTSYPTWANGPETIQGRSKTDYSYLGSVKAKYDDDSSGKYITESVDSFEILKDFPTLSAVLTDMTEGEDTITVNSWDDVNIDALQQFKKVVRKVNPGTVNEKTVLDYDMSMRNEFNFNAILLYYSVYDLDDEYKQPLATNLFGFVLLDGGTGSGDYVLAPIKKKKSFAGQTGYQAYFGNSYSYRVNIKTLSVYDNTDARIDDVTSSNSLYVNDFNDVISTLNRAVDMMNFNSHTINAVQDRYMALQSAVVDLTNTVNELPDDVIVKTLSVVDNLIAAAKVEIQEYVDNEIDDLKERLGLVDDASIEVLGTEEQNVQTYSSSVSADSGMLLGAAPLLRKSSVESDVQTVNPIGGPVRSKYVFGATSRNASRGRLPRKDQMQQLVDERVVLAVTERFDADVNSRIESTVNESVQTAVSAEVNAQLQVALEGQQNLINQQIVRQIQSAFDIAERQRAQDVQEVQPVEQVDITAQVNDAVTTQVTVMLAMMGVLVMDGIVTGKKQKPANVGRYLRGASKNKIDTYATWDGNDWSESVDCTTGKMYSVDSTIYQFNGTTCIPLGQ